MARPGHAELDAEIQDALGRVLDPCSVGAGNPISLLDMGLVRDWRVTAAGDVHVRMCVTGPTCTLVPHFTGQARTELERIEGVRSATPPCSGPRR
jgi:metal-sulfur cluster biosynthetic enzyme